MRFTHLAACLTATFATACGSTTPTTSPPPAPSTAGSVESPAVVPTTPELVTGRLRVIQHQTACCYDEGSISSVIVSDATGATMQTRRFQRFGDIQPVLDVDLPPGTYNIESFQQPCDGSCGNLDPKTDDCTTTIEIASNSTHFVTAEFAPWAGCTLAETDDGPWRRYTCTDLEPDPARVFTLTNCTEPIVLTAADGAPEDPSPSAAQPIVLSRSGGCNDAFFWATNEDSTIALLVDIISDRPSGEQIDMSVDLPHSGITVTLQRGSGLDQALCGDVVDEHYRVDSNIPVKQAHLEIHLDALDSRRCAAADAPNGELELQDVVADDGTSVADASIHTNAIGCYVS